MLDWTKDYLQQRQAEGMMESTIRSLSCKLNIFSKWVEVNCDGDFQKVTPYHIHRFTYWLMTDYIILYGCRRGNKIGLPYVRDILFAVSRFLGWLLQTDQIERNPANRIEIPKRVRILPRNILTLQEIEKLLSSPDTETPMGMRNQAILEVLYGTGIRNQELCRLDVTAIDLGQSTVFIRQGKGRKDRVVPMGKVATRAISTYVRNSRKKLIRSPVEESLFVCLKGKRLTAKVLNQIIGKYVRKCEINRHITAHSIRHTMATHMMENGANIRIVQEQLGHANIQSTELYTHVVKTHLKEVHRKTHPRGRLPGTRQEPKRI